MSDPTVVGQIPPTEESAHQAAKAAKPVRSLPTDRISFAKQLDVLRAYAIGSGSDGKGVSNGELAKITSLNISTVAYNNTFFTEIGLITKGNSGFVPSAPVVSFNRTWAFGDQAKAGHRLAPAFRKTWFGEVLNRLLSMRGSVPVKDAISELADAAQAGPRHTAHLRILLDYVAASGLIEIENETVKRGAESFDGAQQTEVAAPASKVDVPTPTRREVTAKDGAAGGALSTVFTQVPEGTMRVFVDMSVDLKELANWKPEIVSAFFGGIAQVLSAKAMVEQGRSR